MNLLNKLKAPPKKLPSKPPESPQSESAKEPSFLRTGEEAFTAVYAQSFKKSKDIFEHVRPGDLKWNPNTDMTTLSGTQVAQAFQYFTGMHAFAACEISKTDAELVAVEFNMRVIQKTITAVQSGSKRKKYDVDAEIATDKRYIALSEKKASLSIMKIALEATTKGLEDKAACLSREITRRESEARLSSQRHP